MPPRRKPNTQSRKKEPTDEEKKQELKNKLRQKLYEKKMGRSSRATRENRLESLEDQLDNTTNAKERARIQKEIDLLEDIGDKEYENATLADIPDID